MVHELAEGHDAGASDEGNKARTSARHLRLAPTFGATAPCRTPAPLQACNFFNGTGYHLIS